MQTDANTVSFGSHSNIKNIFLGQFKKLLDQSKKWKKTFLKVLQQSKTVSPISFLFIRKNDL